VVEESVDGGTKQLSRKEGGIINSVVSWAERHHLEAWVACWTKRKEEKKRTEDLAPVSSVGKTRLDFPFEMSLQTFFHCFCMPRLDIHAHKTLSA